VPLIELYKDNIIYNDLLNNLNKTLSVYGFKADFQYDIQLYTLYNTHNKDTKLLNDIFGFYNKAKSYKLLKWYIKIKKKIMIKANHLFQYNKKKRFSKSQFHKNTGIGDGSEIYIFERLKKHHTNSYLEFDKESLFKSNYQQDLRL
jgi:hypothetical protein